MFTRKEEGMARAVMFLHFIKNMSVQEIVLVTDIPWMFVQKVCVTNSGKLFEDFVERTTQFLHGRTVNEARAANQIAAIPDTALAIKNAPSVWAVVRKLDADSGQSAKRKFEGRDDAWLLQCPNPAHDDRERSFEVFLRDGRIIMKCHAGCSDEVLLPYVEAALRQEVTLDAS